MHHLAARSLAAVALTTACAGSGHVAILKGGSTPPPVEIAWTAPRMVVRASETGFRADTAFLVESLEEWMAVRRATRVHGDSLHSFDFDDGPVLIVGTGEQGTTGEWIVIDSIGRGPDGDAWVAYSSYTTCSSIHGSSRPIAGVQLRRPLRSVHLVRGPLQYDRRECGPPPRQPR